MYNFWVVQIFVQTAKNAIKYSKYLKIVYKFIPDK